MGDVELGREAFESDEEVEKLVSHSDQVSEKGGASCRRVEGNHVLVYGKSRGRYFPMHCLMGPDWFCSLITLTLIFVPSIYMSVRVLPNFAPLVAITGTTSFLVCAGSFMITAFSDPGIVKRQSRHELEQTMQDVGRIPKNGLLCDVCHVYRPPSARHCFDCNACITGYDHHCPWTGKCIGERTLRSFYVFLFSLLFHLIYTIIVFNVWVARRDTKPL